MGAFVKHRYLIPTYFVLNNGGLLQNINNKYLYLGSYIFFGRRTRRARARLFITLPSDTTRIYLTHPKCPRTHLLLLNFLVALTYRHRLDAYLKNLNSFFRHFTECRTISKSSGFRARFIGKYSGDLTLDGVRESILAPRPNFTKSKSTSIRVFATFVEMKSRWIERKISSTF